MSDEKPYDLSETKEEQIRKNVYPVIMQEQRDYMS